jgi:predicted Zn-dependent peptidase
MQYQKVGEYFHVFCDSNARHKVKMEFLYSHGGSWYEEAADRGKMHLMEHIICSRTKALTFDQFKQYAFEESITYNAFTSPTSLGLEASGHRDDFDKLLEVFFEMFSDPTFTQEDLDREKEIVIREIADRSGSPQYKLYYDVVAELLTPESFSCHQVLGDAKMVAQTTLADLHRLFAQMMERSQLIVCVSGGGIDKEKIVHKIDAFLLQQSNQTKKSSNTQKIALPFTFSNTFLTPDIQKIQHPFGHEECELTLYIPCVVTLQNRAIREVFSNLFLRWSGKGLYDVLRDEKGLIYGYYVGFDNYGQYVNFEMNCELIHAEQIVQVTRDFFADFNARFDQRQFDALKAQLTKKNDLTRDKLGSEVDFAHSTLLNYGTIQDYDQFTLEVRAVTREDIEDFFMSMSQGLSAVKIVAVSQKPEVKNLFLV